MAREKVQTGNPEPDLILLLDCLKVFISEFKGLRGAEEH